MKHLFAWLCFCIGATTHAEQKETEASIEDILSLGLPVLTVLTDNAEEPSADYLKQSDGYPLSTIANATKVPGRTILMTQNDTLYDSGGYVPDKSGMTIKIRGNSSAYGEKKSYKIKLQKKADLLCRPDDGTDYRDKNWVLLRTDQSRSILNIMTGLKINELMGLPWTPAFRYVNVVINGDYRGVYALAESVRRNADCRLNVDKQTGFIVEYDPYYWAEDLYVESSIPSNMHYTFKYPEADEITQAQLDDVTRAIEETEKTIRSNIVTKIDISSFANWLLAHDILGTSDAHGSNIFLMKYDNTDATKVQMCNMWDFDTIAQSEGKWTYVHSPGLFYYYYLFHYSNTPFIDAYESRWREVETTLFDAVQDWLGNFSVSEEARALEASRLLENQRYNKNTNSVSQDVMAFKAWFSDRRLWINSQLSVPAGVTTVMEKRFCDIPYNIKGMPATAILGGIVIKSGKKRLLK